MLRILHLVFLQLWSYVLTIAFNCHIPDVEQLALTMISSLSQDALTRWAFSTLPSKDLHPLPIGILVISQSSCLSWTRWNLSVIHLVPHSVVELSRIRLSVWNRCLLQLTFGGRGLQIFVYGVFSFNTLLHGTEELSGRQLQDWSSCSPRPREVSTIRIMITLYAIPDNDQ